MVINRFKWLWRKLKGKSNNFKFEVYTDNKGDYMVRYVDQWGKTLFTLEKQYNSNELDKYYEMIFAIKETASIATVTEK